MDAILFKFIRVAWSMDIFQEMRHTVTCSSLGATDHVFGNRYLTKLIQSDGILTWASRFLPSMYGTTFSGALVNAIPFSLQLDT